MGPVYILTIKYQGGNCFVPAVKFYFFQARSPFLHEDKRNFFPLKFSFNIFLKKISPLPRCLSLSSSRPWMEWLVHCSKDLPSFLPSSDSYESAPSTRINSWSSTLKEN